MFTGRNPSRNIIRQAVIMGRPSITAMEAAIPEASGMTMTIPKTSGKITKIGMRTRMKRGMSGMMAEQ